MSLLAVVALVPRPARADAVLNECSQHALESALAQGGVVTANCDGTLLLTNPITVALSATLNASGHRLTISSPAGTNSTNGTRLFQVNPGVSFSLINLTLTAGRATNGGAIYNNRGILSLEDCVLSNNLAIGRSGTGGGRGRSSDRLNGADGRNGGNGQQALGGAIFSFHGTTIVSRCSFLTNGAIAGAGGPGGDGGNGYGLGGDGGNGGSGGRAQGGAIYSSGVLIVSNSTFMLNSATAGDGGAGGTNGSGFAASHLGHGGAGGLSGGGAIYNLGGGVLEIVGTTFSLNDARAGASANAGSDRLRARGGKNGASSVGGAVANYGLSAVVNSTFFANKSIGGSAGNGAASDFRGGRGGDGGAAWGGNLYNAKRTAVTNCTFFDGGVTGGTNGLAGTGSVAGDDGHRGAGRGGNIANGNGTFILNNSLMAFPLPGANGYGAFSDAGYNLSSDRSIRFKTAGSRSNIDPRLGLLGRNGGLTETIPLLSDSPAIDAGDPSNRIVVDQRGVARPRGARGDIGAYEFGLTLLAPVIVSQLQSQVAQAGGTISFIIVVNGDGPLTYLWRRGGNAIPEATGPVLTLNNVQASDASTYDVVVSNNSGSVTSTAATLTLINRVVISVPLVDMTVAQGNTATFRIAATGDGPITYQWFFNQTNPIPGATLTSLTLPNVATNQAGVYSVLVSNPFSSIRSAPAVLSVNVIAPGIRVQPASIVVLPDAPAFFTVEALGSLPLRFLWYHNGTNLAGSFLLNSNQSTLVLPSVQPGDAGLYHVVVTNVAGTATSEAATLALDAFMPIIGAQPTNTTALQGDVATFRVSATGTAPIFYQWFFNGTTPVAGGTGALLTIANAGAANAGSYHVVVSNRFGAVASDAATLTVMFVPPAISAQPASVAVFSGEDALFSVAATGSSPLSYQWFFNTVLIPGATASALGLSNVTSAVAGEYFVVISNPAGNTTSDIVTLTVDDAAPQITLQPTNADLLLGSNVTFSVTATGSRPFFYQWFLDDVEIPGATNATLSLTNLALADAGAYRVTITNALGSIDSEVATLTLLSPFSVSCTADEPITCTIMFESEINFDYTLQWFDTETQGWMPLETLTGDGGTMQFMDMPITSPDAPAYRIVIEATPVP
ncbi:MAG: hypothetical protein QOF48_1608 [Verrucomicrobiota bacterium]